MAAAQRYNGSMSRDVISTANAPAAIGPYSQAIRAGGLIFASGQIPIEPESGTLLANADIAVQTERALRNVQAILEAAHSNLAKVVKTTVFLADLRDFTAMNEVYEKFFPSAPPARSTVEVSRLPRDVKVEIEVIAVA